MPSRIKPVGMHIAAPAGLASTAPASATPAISNTESVFFIYLLPGDAETMDRSRPVPKHRFGEAVPPRSMVKMASQILRFSILGSIADNVLAANRKRNLGKRRDESERQI